MGFSTIVVEVVLVVCTWSSEKVGALRMVGVQRGRQLLKKKTWSRIYFTYPEEKTNNYNEQILVQKVELLKYF